MIKQTTKGLLILLSLLLVASCNSPVVESGKNSNKMSQKEPKETQFELFDIDFDAKLNVKEYLNEGDYSSWVADNLSGKIFIETIHSKGKSTTYSSISSYDNFLSTGLSNRDNYTKEEISIDGTLFRLIEGSFGADTNFIELYATDVCFDGSQILITTKDVTMKDKEWLKKCFQSIKIYCVD